MGSGDDARYRAALEELEQGYPEKAGELAQVWRALGAVPPAPALSEAAIERSLAAVNAGIDRGELETEPAPSMGWGWWVPVPLAVGAAFVTLMLWLGPLPGAQAWPVAAGVLAVALLLAATAVRLGKGAVVGAVVASVGASALAASSAQGGALFFGCPVLEAVAGILPLGMAALVAWRRPAARGVWSLGAAAAAGAVAGQGLLVLACPTRDITHVMVFHSGGVLLSAMLGMGLGLLPAFRRARG